ncbi:enoyl-CoA hydratase/carnithine racemase [Jatrophihabitans sp. GAS493]|uniref:enoyl-CoA hydratase-related protein n=1 Tax=Jatrophihabitans sp. GAS493 TaxID=1907575 RepID=UPI000BB936C2|nr:enoyl-CoA hydratase-related protein [Jatrophihabitans sp. GAS493]SOD72101.1 enoyl-CoA hydratase/carnithine racemase [Jatrophihabitans sp. GAS493]
MTVTTERRGRVLVITLRREAKRNAIDSSITAGIDLALNELDDEPELWCGVLTGGTQVFCAGADLSVGPGSPTERGGIAGIITRSRRTPLIAAVEGLALGGGMELVLCCDLVVAATNASFGLPEARRGLMPDFGGAFRVAKALPANVARELLLTTDNLTAERAERLGFVNMLVEPGKALEGAIALAERVCENAPVAVRESLAIVNATLNADEADDWARSDAAHERLLATEDVAEGIGAFFERRPPTWRNA